MKKFIEINTQNIDYLRELFGLSLKDFLSRVNGSRTRDTLSQEHLDRGSVSLGVLKRIDKVFEKGLSYYTDPSDPPRNKSASIFFRKKDFNTSLDFADRKFIHKVESHIHHLSALCDLSGHHIGRKLKRYKPKDNPQAVAREVDSLLYPEEETKDDKGFLEVLIKTFAQQHILVYEFVEPPNTAEKVNLEGCFLQPHYIVLKRQKSDRLKREIFTLCHELGHYLLDKEEVEREVVERDPDKLQDIEHWCNAFAYAFLTRGEEIALTTDISDGGLCEASRRLHLSRLAIFTHWAVKGEISWEDYDSLKTDLQQEYEETEAKKQRKKAEGEKQFGRNPKPIFSPLEEDIYAFAYYEGVVDEYDIESDLTERKYLGTEKIGKIINGIVYG